MHKAKPVYILLLIITFSISIFAQKVDDEKFINKKEQSISSANSVNAAETIGDTVSIKNGSKILMTVTEETTGGSIKLKDAGTVSSTTNKLYNSGGNLMWDGNQLGSGSSNVVKIDDLSDARTLANNLFLGGGSGSNTSGSVDYNIGVGNFSLFNNSSGWSNIAVGALTLEQSTTSNDNVAIGTLALNRNTTGNNNVGIGTSSNYYNQTGFNNTLLGFEAGKGTALHNKSGNVFLGYQAGFNEIRSDRLYIENSNSNKPLIYGNFDSDSVHINGDFHVNGHISVENDKSISGLDNLVGYNDLKLYGNSGTIDIYISSGGHIGMGENNPSDAKLVVKKGNNDYAGKFDGKVLVTDVLEVSNSGIEFKDGDTEDDNIIKKTTKMKYYICISGVFPSGTANGTLLGEIKLLPYINASTVSGGWLPCEGQVLSTTTYSSLFSLIGFTYGGDETSTFALPDMRNAIPNHN